MLEVTEDNGIVVLTLNKPPANALDNATLRRLVGKLAEINADTSVRGVLLTAAGDRFFCAGGDVKEFSVITRELGLERVRLGSRLKSGLAQLECPYVCAVNGAAIGSGMEMAALADFCVASDTARFGMPEINHGLLPMAKGVQQLVRVMGEKATKEVLFSGEIFSAARALEYGLVDEVVPADRLQDRAREWLEDMAAKPPQLFRALKRTVRDSVAMTDDELERLTEDDFLGYFQTAEAAAQLDALAAGR